ncbi:hypothetical protein KDA00_02305 [Candidatus Saccharibacteria bacterium]|nr:hypothetical protein [Candidatus Saccharibacteria bacterium]
MDTPKTPDIYAPPLTASLLRYANQDLVEPDYIVRNDKDDPTIYVFGWEHADELAAAAEVAERVAVEDFEAIRIRTFRAMLDGMRSVVGP